MTGRQHLDRRVSLTAVILGLSLGVWLIALSQFDADDEPRNIMAIPVVGIVLCTIYHVLMIRCPHCRKSLGHLARPLIDFSLFRFPKRVRFCPYCMTDFEDELGPRR
jgi:hypothetical protein